MSEKQFKIYEDSVRKFESNMIYGVKSDTVCLEPFMTFKEAEKCCDVLNEQQATIDKLEQRDYYNQSERYKILGRAIELTANYIANSDEEHYDFCALVTEFEKELLDDE